MIQNGLDLTIKQLKRANYNSPWAIWEGLLPERYLYLRFGGLISGRTNFWTGLLLEFYGINTRENVFH